MLLVCDILRHCVYFHYLYGKLCILWLQYVLYYIRLRTRRHSNKKVYAISKYHTLCDVLQSICRLQLVFTAPWACVCVCLSVCLSVSVSVSVASRSSTKTAKLRITQITPHDSPGTLVFWCQRSPQNSTGHLLRERRMQVGWVKIGDFWLITGYISKTVQDRHMLPIKVE